MKLKEDDPRQFTSAAFCVRKIENPMSVCGSKKCCGSASASGLVCRPHPTGADVSHSLPSGEEANARLYIVFSERKLTFTFARCHRPSVCLSVSRL